MPPTLEITEQRRAFGFLRWAPKACFCSRTLCPLPVHLQGPFPRAFDLLGVPQAACLCRWDFLLTGGQGFAGNFALE